MIPVEIRFSENPRGIMYVFFFLTYDIHSFISYLHIHFHIHIHIHSLHILIFLHIYIHIYLLDRPVPFECFGHSRPVPVLHEVFKDQEVFQALLRSQIGTGRAIVPLL